VSEIEVMCDKLPDVPVIVTVTMPVVAVVLAVSVKALVEVAGFGLNDAVTPLGRPEADKLTLLLKLFWGVRVMVLEPVAPCVIVTLLGDAESVKSGMKTGFTVSATVVLFDKLPEVPVMMTLTVPVVAVLLAVRAKELVFVVLVGLKEAVTPVGRPEADKLTLPLKPFCGVTVIVLVPVAPCVMVRLLGDAEIVKFGTGMGFTVREIVVAFDKLSEVPVMVTVTVPVADVLLAVNVNVLVLVALVGLKEADTPPGRPEADKLTLPLKPLCGVTVIVVVPLAPCVIAKLLGDAESTKPGVGEDPGQLLTKLAALRVPIPVAKSHPVVAG